MPARPRSWWKALLALGIGSIAAVLLFELAARAMVTHADLARVWPPGAHAVFEPVPELMPGVSGPAHFDVNSFGLRGREHDYADPSALRVLCLGGSTTECLYLDGPESWPGRLESELARGGEKSAWVGNAGRSGITTREHVVQLEELLRQMPPPGLVVLLCGVNNLCRRLAQGDTYDPHCLEHPECRATVMTSAFAVLPVGQDPRQPFYKETYAWRALRSLVQRVTDAPLIQDRSGQVYAVWREHRASASEMREALPDLTSALGEYRLNLVALVELCRELGIKLLLCTQPCLWRANLPPELERLCWMGGVGEYQIERGHPYYSIEALAQGMQLYNDEMRALAAERGIALLDLAARLPQDTSAFYDDVHFNEHGAQLVVAELLPVVRDLLHP